MANVISISQPRIAQVIRKWREKYSGGIAGALTGLMADLNSRVSDTDSSVKSDAPYVEVFAVRSEWTELYFVVKVHLWAFVVDEWSFSSASNSGLRPLLAQNGDSAPKIPWRKLKADPRGIGRNTAITWRHPLDLSTDYWRALEEMLISGVDTRRGDPKAKLQELRLRAAFPATWKRRKVSSNREEEKRTSEVDAFIRAIVPLVQKNKG